MILTRAAAAAALVAGLAVWPDGRAEAQAGCTFVLGFAALRAAVGADRVGGCLEDEHANPENGDALQRTSGGLLVWRKADNWTAFTDGYRTWVNGPLGLQQRLNGERFDWEAAPPEPPASGPGLPDAVARGARALAAQRLGVPSDGIVLTRAESVEWSDSSLGCPEPGRAYAQVITPGYRIVAQAGGRTLEVHTDAAGRGAVAC